MNAWIYLAIGVLLEIVGTTNLKLSNGFTELWPSLLCVLCFTAALFLISLSVKTLDVSIAYAIWSGAGIALLTVIGAIYFQESLGIAKIFFIGLIVVGIVGLHSVSSPVDMGNAAATKQKRL